MEPRHLYYAMVWPLAGAAVGYSAAQQRGYSPAVGIALGLLLGPLFAWGLFLIDGIFSPNEKKRCQHCAEWIEPGASVCRFCGRDLPPQPKGPARLLRLVRSRASLGDRSRERAG